MPTRYTYRMDFTQGPSTWTFRHSISHELGYDPFAIPDMGINTDTDVQQMVFSNTRTIGSNKLNDIRIRVRLSEERPHLAARRQPERRQGARHQPAERQPAVLGRARTSASRGCRGLGEESDAPFINDDKTLQFVDNFTWTVAKHSFKFGGELRHVIYDQIGGVVTRGRFGFDGRYTQNPLLPAAQRGGAAFADFLLGTFNNSGGAGRRADRQFPVQLLRPLRPGQLAARVERDDELRAAVGVRPAVHGHERRDREHRLRLGQHACAGVRPRGHGRSV